MIGEMMPPQDIREEFHRSSRLLQDTTISLADRLVGIYRNHFQYIDPAELPAQLALPFRLVLPTLVHIADAKPIPAQLASYSLTYTHLLNNLAQNIVFLVEAYDQLTTHWVTLSKPGRLKTNPGFQRQA